MFNFGCSLIRPISHSGLLLSHAAVTFNNNLQHVRLSKVSKLIWKWQVYRQVKNESDHMVFGTTFRPL